jgi:hypothetical protein
MYCKVQALLKNGKLHMQTLLSFKFGPFHARAAAAHWTCVAPWAQTNTSSARYKTGCTSMYSHSASRWAGSTVSILVPGEGYIP